MQIRPYIPEWYSIQSLFTEYSNIKIYIKKIARSQKAALNAYHQLSRCQVGLNKRLLSEIVLLIRIGVFEFCNILICWVLSQFQFLKVVKLWVEFCPNSSFWVLLQFKFYLLTNLNIQLIYFYLCFRCFKIEFLVPFDISSYISGLFYHRCQPMLL